MNNITEQRIITTQPYTISVKVGADVDSKGKVKPSCEIKIIRMLENGDEISELIKADVSRGVDECMTGISEVLRRAEMMR